MGHSETDATRRDLDSIRRQLRLAHAVAGLALAVSVAAVALTLGRPRPTPPPTPSTPGIVEARGFVLRDEQGVTRAVLGPEKDGSASLRLFNGLEGGKRQRVRLWASRQGHASLMLYGADEGELVQIFAKDADGKASDSGVRIFDGFGDVRFQAMSLGPRTVYTLVDGEGRPVAVPGR